MAVTIKPLVKAKELETVLTDQYVAIDLTARIEAACLTNNGAAVRNVSVHLVRQGGVAGPSNLLIAVRSLAIGESYPCPEIIGQALANGDKITALSSGAGVAFMVSGSEITG